MRTYPLDLGTDSVAVHVLESPADIPALVAWAYEPRLAMGLDVETTGLDTFSRTFRVRSIQVGDARSAWFIPAEGMDPAVRQAVHHVLAEAPRLVLHNAPFDLLALDRFGYLDLEATWPRVFDTRLMAHLLDPRPVHEGGKGLGLKDLSTHFVGANADQAQEELRAVFRANGWKLADGWAQVDLQEPAFIRYAGMDPVLTVRLFEALGPLVQSREFGTLFEFEKAVSLVCTKMQRRGLLLDVPYAQGLIRHFDEEEAAGMIDAARLGIDSVNSPKQVAEVLEALGATLTETTATGAPKVDKAVLEAIIEEGGPAAVAAAAVQRAKQAGKYRSSYVQASLDGRDGRNRVHPTINSLQARTARMSISDPPLQQLPSGDWMIRRMFVPSPGMALVSVDYSAVEMRVLAALANETTMKAAILAGEDIHDSTARLLFGEDFTKAQRKLAKVAGFGKVYGGGVVSLARQSGTTPEVMQKVVQKYDRTYPGIKRYSRRLMDRAEMGRLDVVTPSGRHLPLDRDRVYAATNYVVQSTARDVLAQALLRLDETDLGDYLLLPIHDEVLAEVPSQDAEDIARAIGETMNMDFMGVPLLTEPEVLGASWGHGYGAPD
jgi:DNA polymerase-1